MTQTILHGKWAPAIDKVLVNGVVMPDLGKAFELVNHAVLQENIAIAVSSWRDSLKGQSRCCARNVRAVVNKEGSSR